MSTIDDIEPHAVITAASANNTIVAAEIERLAIEAALELTIRPGTDHFKEQKSLRDGSIAVATVANGYATFVKRDADGKPVKTKDGRSYELVTGPCLNLGLAMKVQNILRGAMDPEVNGENHAHNLDIVKNLYREIHALGVQWDPTFNHNTDYMLGIDEQAAAAKKNYDNCEFGCDEDGHSLVDYPARPVFTCAEQMALALFCSRTERKIIQLNDLNSGMSIPMFTVAGNYVKRDGSVHVETVDCCIFCNTLPAPSKVIPVSDLMALIESSGEVVTWDERRPFGTDGEKRKALVIDRGPGEGVVAIPLTKKVISEMAKYKSFAHIREAIESGGYIPVRVDGELTLAPATLKPETEEKYDIINSICKGLDAKMKEGTGLVETLQELCDQLDKREENTSMPRSTGLRKLLDESPLGYAPELGDVLKALSSTSGRTFEAPLKQFVMAKYSEVALSKRSEQARNCCIVFTDSASHQLATMIENGREPANRTTYANAVRLKAQDTERELFGRV